MDLKGVDYGAHQAHSNVHVRIPHPLQLPRSFPDRNAERSREGKSFFPCCAVNHFSVLPLQDFEESP